MANISHALKAQKRKVIKFTAPSCNLQMQMCFYFWYPPALHLQADDFTSVCSLLPFSVIQFENLRQLYICIYIYTYIFVYIQSVVLYVQTYMQNFTQWELTWWRLLVTTPVQRLVFNFNLKKKCYENSSSF